MTVKTEREEAKEPNKKREQLKWKTFFSIAVIRFFRFSLINITLQGITSCYRYKSEIVSHYHSAALYLTLSFFKQTHQYASSTLLYSFSQSFLLLTRHKVHHLTLMLNLPEKRKENRVSNTQNKSRIMMMTRIIPSLDYTSVKLSTTHKWKNEHEKQRQKQQKPVIKFTQLKQLRFAIHELRIFQLSASKKIHPNSRWASKAEIFSKQMPFGQMQWNNFQRSNQTRGARPWKRSIFPVARLSRRPKNHILSCMRVCSRDLPCSNFPSIPDISFCHWFQFSRFATSDHDDCSFHSSGDAYPLPFSFERREKRCEKS